MCAADIRDRGEIMVPAGRGRTAFVDALDVAAVAAAALLHPAAHAGRSWTPTGPALTYDQVATVLQTPAPMAAVTTVLHTTAPLGLAGLETDDVAAVPGRPPTSFAEFAHRERAAWLVPGS